MIEAEISHLVESVRRNFNTIQQCYEEAEADAELMRGAVERLGAALMAAGVPGRMVDEIAFPGGIDKWRSNGEVS